jgi:hypothetical protein
MTLYFLYFRFFYRIFYHKIKNRGKKVRLCTVQWWTFNVFLTLN